MRQAIGGKGLSYFKEDETHNKYMALTEKGMAYYEESQRLKQEIEAENVSRIGEDAMKQLKELLAEN